MAKDWDYANLAHTAKEFGGPEKYLQIVKDHSFQEGRKEQLIIDGVIVVGAGCLYLGAKAIKHFKKKKVTAEQAKDEVQIGDYVVYPSKADRKINIGVIESDYYNEPAENKYTQRRKVKWLKSFPRTDFSQGALYEVGSALTFFQVKNYADEYLAALEGKKASLDTSIDESIGATADEIQEITKDFILKELSKKLKGYDFENFVANLLNAMGYRTKVSKQGGDSGIDIVAYKDEFPPRICVQVKSIDSDIKEATIQSLRGAMSEGDYGVFVTLSDYTPNAKAYLEQHPIIRGLNGSEVVDLVLRYYDDLDDKYQDMIPLKRVYIPVLSEDFSTLE